MAQQRFTVQGKALAENPSQIPWQAYPRPQLRRDSFINLNGDWEFEVSQTRFPEAFTRTIRVPFCPESVLSGIGEHFPEGSTLCYRRHFSHPAPEQTCRVLLHIGAADQHLTCQVNGQRVGTHTGGYEAICFDISDFLDDDNELVLLCRDDLRETAHPHGKQSNHPGGLWYTPVSGLWQTVWLEVVPLHYIRALQTTCTANTVTITTEPRLDGTVTIEALGSFPLERGVCQLEMEQPRLWSPEDPWLYNFTVETQEDRVESYFAMRTLEIREAGGCPRLCLNGKPYFFHGLLDQGYWPDGLFLPADPEGYARDVAGAKALGFNTLRKHIKVEPEEFYYQCDLQGMVVVQDMVCNGSYRFLTDTVLPTLGIQKLDDRRMHDDENARRCFLEGMEATVHQLKNHPCICCWTIFNEGWGQFDSDNAFERLHALDNSRFIDTTSGWFRCHKTDVDSRHVYFSPLWALKAGNKPLVVSEFGGISCKTPGHMYRPGQGFGYRICGSFPALRQALTKLYLQKLTGCIRKGLCAAVYTQLSDVEDEINGLYSYDRQVCKVSGSWMAAVAAALTAAYAVATADDPESHTEPLPPTQPESIEA